MTTENQKGAVSGGENVPAFAPPTGSGRYSTGSFYPSKNFF